MKAFDMTCPKCGGQMEIDSASNKLICPQCDTTISLDPEAIHAKRQEERHRLGFGTLSMLLGVSSLLTCGMLFVPEIAAVVMALASFIREHREKNQIAHAAIGLLTGLIAPLLAAFYFIYYPNFKL